MRPGLGGLLDLGGAALRPVARVANEVTLAAVDGILDSRLAGEIADRVVASRLVQQAVDRALDGPVMHTLDGDALDRVVDALLESDELWRIVDEIASSPAVTDAITQQSLGFADQVAGGVRDRSRSADAVLERVARRALRRKAASPPPAE
jgi:hypothetical protein